MPIAWNAEMDRKLLLAILKVHDITIDKTKVAEELSTEEQPCTTMAIQKRLQAIKAMIKGGSGGDASTKPKATPHKRGAAGAMDDESPEKKRKAGGGKGTSRKAQNGNEPGGDAETAHEVQVKAEEEMGGDEFAF